MRVTSLDHVGIRVRDMSAATEFYCGLLDLRVNERKPNWLSLPDGRMIHLMPATDRSRDGNDIGDLARHCAFRVDNLEEAVTTLLAKGLRPFQVELGAGGRRKDLVDADDLSFGIGTVFVSDPDGNVLEFVDIGRGIFKDVQGP